MAEKGQEDRKMDQSQAGETADGMTLEQIFSRLEEITKKMENPETAWRMPLLSIRREIPF